MSEANVATSTIPLARLTAAMPEFDRRRAVLERAAAAVLTAPADARALAGLCEADQGLVLAQTMLRDAEAASQALGDTAAVELARIRPMLEAFTRLVDQTYRVAAWRGAGGAVRGPVQPGAAD